MGLEELIIRSAADARDILALRAEPWHEDAVDYYEGTAARVELSCGGLHAQSVLPAYVADAERLAPFFDEIDREWRGWVGEKAAGMPDRDWLSVSAKHDGRGHVLLTVQLAEGWPIEAEWSVRATMPIDVGSSRRDRGGSRSMDCGRLATGASLAITVRVGVAQLGPIRVG